MGKATSATILKSSLIRKKGIAELMLFILSIALYCNTFGHQFTQDDAIVIYDNVYVSEGIGGWHDIFTKDSFSGFFKGQDKSELVSGGRYRPFSIAFFALVYELFGSAPAIYHILAVLFYALLVVLLFRVVLYFVPEKMKGSSRIFAFLSALLFAAHPIHTEVVANVKGLDETFSLTFSLLALLAAFRFLKSGRWIFLPFVCLSLFIALLSKESAAVFVVVIPSVLFFWKTTNKAKNLFLPTILVFLTFGLYWVIRTNIVGANFGDPPFEMMNNPFIKFENGQYLNFKSGEKVASIIIGIGKYIQLLFFPHPLTHDYYPRHFGVYQMSDLATIMSVVMNGTLMLIALIGIKKKSFLSLCIAFFYVGIAMVSNVFFPIGTHLSERFLFVPSIAFVLILAYFFVLWHRQSSNKIIMPIALTLVLGLYSLKTVSRNSVWKNDFTLFTTDVKTSVNSAKVRNAAGGALLTASQEESDQAKKNEMIYEAIGHLTRAVEIHPNYKEAHLLLGNGNWYIQNFDASILSYENALRINPYYDIARTNLLIVLKEGAREVGGKQRDFSRAIAYLHKALILEPDDAHTIALLGTAYGSSGDHRTAIEYFTKAIALNPNEASTYVNLGYAQLNMGMEEDAQINFNKAVQINPRALDQIQNGN